MQGSLLNEPEMRGGYPVTRYFEKKSVISVVATSCFFLAGAAPAFARTVPQIVVPHIVLGDLQNVVAPPQDAKGADYAAKGLPVGAFRLFPTLDLRLDFDDNIYRTNTGEKSDTIFEWS